MRFLIVSIFSLSALTPAFSQELPDTTDPVMKGLIEQYLKDKRLLESPNFWDIPAPLPAWPCAISEVEQYKLVGLQMAHPELKQEYEKRTRKNIRELGMSADNIPKTTFSNVQIIPLKAQCSNGKLDGDIQVLSIYDQRTEVKSTVPSGANVITSIMLNTVQSATRSHISFKNGVANPSSTAFVKNIIQSERHFDNEQMEAQQRKTNEQLGLNKPSTARSVIYTAAGGLMANFSLSDEKKVNGGLFGVNVESVPTLTTMFTLPVDENRSQVINYKDKLLTSKAFLKDGKPHGEQVIYMENYLKKYNRRLDQTPGMEDAREVTINGVDLIERRTCMQNGVQVKISPCPTQ